MISVIQWGSSDNKSSEYHSTICVILWDLIINIVKSCFILNLISKTLIILAVNYEIIPIFSTIMNMKIMNGKIIYNGRCGNKQLEMHIFFVNFLTDKKKDYFWKVSLY